MMVLVALVILLLLIGGGVWAWPLLAAALGLSNVADKPGALQHIKQLMQTYDISPAEVDAAFHAPAGPAAASADRSKRGVARTLFTYLGAIFILAGISTYIGTFWDTMGGLPRILITLGVGYILLIVLVSALHEQRYPKLILPLTFIGAFMMTGGWYVFLDEVFPQSDNWRGATLFVCGVMAVHQALLFARYSRTVFALTTLIFTYGFLHVGLDLLGLDVAYIAIVLGASVFLVGAAVEETAHRALAEPALLIGSSWLNSGLFDRVALYTSGSSANLVIGFSLMLTAYGLHKAERYPRLIGLGYFVGSLMAYAGLFDLVYQTPLELTYLAVTTAVLYACVLLESRALLLTTVFAMLGFIGYFSAEHFANSLGWPLTLVLMGLAFLGVSTLALRVKNRI